MCIRNLRNGKPNTDRPARRYPEIETGMELTLEVGHEGFSARVERVDDHFAVGRTCDFDTAIFETRSRCGTHPGRISADVRGLGGEVELGARIKSALGSVSCCQ